VYDKYYASLVASSAAASAQVTPTATGFPSSSSNSPDFPNVEEEEEDKKPNVEYLDSLNAYRKRSRSQEDVGAATKIKHAKVETVVNGFANGNGIPNGHIEVNGHARLNGTTVVSSFAAEASDALMTYYESATAEPEEPQDDPIVNGEWIASCFFEI
jgi:transcription initiation factor TFIIE subunit alpha